MRGLERVLIVLDDKSGHLSKAEGVVAALQRRLDLEVFLGLHRLDVCDRKGVAEDGSSALFHVGPVVLRID